MRAHTFVSTCSTVLSIALLELAVPASAQTVTPVLNRTWAEMFGGIGNDSIQALAARPDGGMFFAGRSSSFSHGDDLWVGRLDRRGRAIWEVTLGLNDFDDGLALLATPDGGCIVGGATNTFGSPVLGEGWIVKLDASGGVTWQKTYGSEDDESIRSLALSPDGYYAAGTINDDVGADPWLFEIDVDGNVLWQERFPANGFDNVASLEATDTGVALLCSSSSSFPTAPGFPFQRPWLLNLDGDGNVLWQRIYNFSGGDYWSEVRTLPDGSFIAVGEVLANAFFGGDVWVVRLNANGTVRWDRRFGDNFFNFNIDSGVAVRPTAEGFAVFASTRTGREGLWLLQLDSLGNRLWDRTYGVGSFQNASAFDIAPNGDRLLAGSFFNLSGDQDSFLLRLTPGGRGPLGCELSSLTDPNEWSGVVESILVTQDPEPTTHGTKDTLAIPLPVNSGRFLCSSIGS